MADYRWTDEQRRAIEWEGTPILVSAAAGSGKTAVLVERVMSRLLSEDNGCDIDKFLIVTFTRAAAGEMRQKIAARLLSELEKDPDNKRLSRQLNLIHKASIQTVHSFCSEIIRENAHLLDIPPRFRMAEETELSLMKTELLEQVLESYYEEGDNEGFLSLVDMFGSGRNDNAVLKLLLDLYEKSQNHPDPGRFLERIMESFDISVDTRLEDTTWGGYVLEYAREATRHFIALNKGIRPLLIEEPALKKAYLPAFDEDAALLLQLEEALAAGSFEEVAALLSELSFLSLKSSRGCADEGLLMRAKEVRAEIKEGLASLRSRFFYMPPSEFMKDIAACAPAMRTLCLMTLRFIEVLGDEKRRKNLLDFSDLEHLAFSLLIKEGGEPSETAMEIRRRYRYILVDEYQDTNEIQDMMFRAVSRDGQNLFMVGDVKQSIYAFRQANPRIFLEKYLSFSKDEDAQIGRKIIFSKNFRSRREVLSGVNSLFDVIMSQGLGEIDYGEDERLYLGACYPEEGSLGESELILVHGEGGQEGEDDETPDALSCEAAAVALRITELMKEGHMVSDVPSGEPRPLRYGDIVILLRSIKGRAEAYERALAAAGIPVTSDSSSGFFETAEIMTVMSLLRVIDNPRQDIALISLLRGPVFAFDEDRLLAIRNEGESGGDFYSALKKTAQGGDEACIRFLEKLDGWRTLARNRPVDFLVWQLYGETGLWGIAGAMAGGERRQANLTLFFELCRRYEETSYKGLFNFINYLNRIMENDADIAPAPIAAANEDAVRIMSIHKSKGLEFPVCIVASMGKRFNMTDTRGPLLIDADLGLGPQFRDTYRSITYPTIAKEALSIKSARATLSEEQRILYVAMTRAKERLILVGSCDRLDKKIYSAAARAGDGVEKPSAFAVSGLNSYLDWLLCAMAWHDGAGIAAMLALPDEDTSTRVAGFLVRALPKRGVTGAAVPLAEAKEEPCSQGGEQDDEYIKAGLLELSRRYCFSYPWPGLSRTPSKLSVSEAKGRVEEQDRGDLRTGAMPIIEQRRRPIPVPRFIEERRGLSAVERGTALHLVLQYISFEELSSLDSIKEEIVRMLARELITKEQAEAVNPAAILTFFESPLGQRLRASKTVRREERFTLLLPSHELTTGATGPHGRSNVLLQGVIDCFFEEEDGSVVLIDFKTDKIRGPADEIKERYTFQINMYKRAVEEVYCKKVKEAYLYLFDRSLPVKIEPS